MHAVLCHRATRYFASTRRRRRLRAALPKDPAVQPVNEGARIRWFKGFTYSGIIVAGFGTIWDLLPGCLRLHLPRLRAVIIGAGLISGARCPSRVQAATSHTAWSSEFGLGMLIRARNVNMCAEPPTNAGTKLRMWRWSPFLAPIVIASLFWGGGQAQAQVHGPSPSISPPPAAIVRTPGPAQIPSDIAPPRDAPAEQTVVPPRQQVFSGRASQLSGIFKTLVTGLVRGRSYEDIAGMGQPEAVAALTSAGIIGVDPKMPGTFVRIASGAVANGRNPRSAVEAAVEIVYAMHLAATGNKPRFGTVTAAVLATRGAPEPGGAPPATTVAVPAVAPPAATVPPGPATAIAAPPAPATSAPVSPPPPATVAPPAGTSPPPATATAPPPAAAPPPVAGTPVVPAAPPPVTVAAAPPVPAPATAGPPAMAPTQVVPAAVPPAAPLPTATPIKPPGCNAVCQQKVAVLQAEADAIRRQADTEYYKEIGKATVSTIFGGIGLFFGVALTTVGAPVVGAIVATTVGVAGLATMVTINEGEVDRSIIIESVKVTLNATVPTSGTIAGEVAKTILLEGGGYAANSYAGE